MLAAEVSRRLDDAFAEDAPADVLAGLRAVFVDCLGFDTGGAGEPLDAPAGDARVLARSGPHRVVGLAQPGLDRADQRRAVDALEDAGDGVPVVAFVDGRGDACHLVAPAEGRGCRRLLLGCGRFHDRVGRRLARLAADGPVRERVREAFDPDPLVREFRADAREWVDRLERRLRGRDVDAGTARAGARHVLLQVCCLHLLAASDRVDREVVAALADRPDVHGRLRATFDGTGRAPSGDPLEDVPRVDGGPFAADPLAAEGVALGDDLLGSLLEALGTYEFTAVEGPPTDVDVAVGPDTLGAVYESLVSEAEAAGVVYTPRAEVDLLTRLALADRLEAACEGKSLEACLDLTFGTDSVGGDGASLRAHLADLRVLDPACGTGAFLVGTLEAVLDCYRRLGVDPGFALARRVIEASLHGVDLAPGVVRVAETRLWLSALARGEADSPAPLSPSLRVGDGLRPDGDRYDLVLGNPPYVRGEEVGDVAGSDRTAGSYEDRLRERFRERFEAVPDRRSDLYVHFFYRGLEALEAGGTLAFLTSNAWLDSGYGESLRETLCRAADLRYVIESRTSRTFDGAAVNPVLTVARRGEAGAEPAFVSVAAPLERVDGAALGRLLNGSGHRVTYRGEPVTVRERGDYRRVGLSTGALGRLDASETGERTAGGGWGRFLRAPPVFYEAVEAAGDALVPLSSLATVRYGVKAGNATFMVLSRRAEFSERADVVTFRVDGRRFAVEREFVRPWLLPGDVDGYAVTDATHRVFCCRRPREALAGTGALEYVEFGEARGVHRGRSLAARTPWYDVLSGGGPATAPPVLVPKLPYERVFFPHNAVDGLPSSNLYRVYPDGDPRLACALLNTTWFVLTYCVEMAHALGHGAGAMSVSTLRDVLAVDPDAVPNDRVPVVGEAFDRMCEREVGTVFEELGAETPADVTLEGVTSDRRALDRVVNRAVLGLSAEQERALYRGVVRLVRDRLDRARTG